MLVTVAAFSRFFTGLQAICTHPSIGDIISLLVETADMGSDLWRDLKALSR